MAAPPSLNLLGEIGILSSLVSWSLFLMFILYFCSAAYTLYIYSYSQHGSVYSGLYTCSLAYVCEFLLLFLHWCPDLVCGAGDTVFISDLCLCLFVLLDLFFFYFRGDGFILGACILL